MSEVKATISSESSAPPFLRENLIQTAVKFLIHPNVLPRSMEQKKGFLSSKGLTEAEMHEAISRSLNATLTPGPAQLPAQVSVPVPYLPQAVSPHVSTFERIRRFLNTLVLLGGLGYGIYWLYKTYIEPFLFGRKKLKAKPVEDRITDLEETVKTGLAGIRVELGELEKSTSGANKSHVKLATFQQIKEIQDSLSSVKGLLLSRQQFPPVPVVTPLKSSSNVSIPSWQLSEVVADGVNQTDSSNGIHSIEEEVTTT